jgi:lysozyme
LELIKHFEQGPKGGHATHPYQDSTGHMTIGWGHLIRKGETFVTPMSAQAADALLRKDVIWAEDDANGLLDDYNIQPTQDQFDALVSIIFNCGAGVHDGVMGDIADSTLLRKWAAGDVVGAGDQFLVWNKGRINGKLTAIPGLTRRRQSERHLFRYGVLKFYF